MYIQGKKRSKYIDLSIRLLKTEVFWLKIVSAPMPDLQLLNANIARDTYSSSAKGILLLSYVFKTYNTRVRNALIITEISKVYILCLR